MKRYFAKWWLSYGVLEAIQEPRGYWRVMLGTAPFRFRADKHLFENRADAVEWVEKQRGRKIELLKQQIKTLEGMVF